MKITLEDFTNQLDKLISDGLNGGVPPEFIVMRLAMNQHEVANFSIAINRSKEEEKQAQELTGKIVGLNGQPVKRK